MDFFEHQEKAKNKTVWLVFFFGVAVTLIVLAVYLVAAVNFRISPTLEPEHWEISGLLRYWDPQLFAWVGGGTLLLILSGSLYKIKVLGDRGGEGVAEMFVGEYLHSGTRNADEKRLVNIVEEMSIAAGISVPRIYLMEGEGINAFAAGYSVNNAVIGVTRGCLQKLSRQELQGVIAHEFSHIINGDMKINIQLIGLLHGILLLSIVGRTLMRATSRGRGKGRGPLIAVGLSLMIIGSIGVFFGRLIKAGVSRQREFLADATAVQYTRDPGGIYGALEKISLDDHGSIVDNPASEEVAHLFFGNAVTSSFLGQAFGLLASHPPLKERMKRVLPTISHRDRESISSTDQVERVDRVELVEHSDPRWAGEEVGSSTFSSFGGDFTASLSSSAADGVTALSLGSINHIESSSIEVGTLDKSGMDKAGDWLRNISPPIANNLESPRGGASVLLSILLTRTHMAGGARGTTETNLLDKDSSEIWRKAADLMPEVKKLETEEILPLVDLSLFSIRNLSRRNLEAIYSRTISIDEFRDPDTLFDYMISSFIRARLMELTQPRSFPDPRGWDVLRYLGSISVIVSVLSRNGHPEDMPGAEKSFQYSIGVLSQQYPKEAKHLRFQKMIQRGVLDANDCTLKVFDSALFSMKDADPLLKKDFLKACYACIFRDKDLRAEELELFRAIAGVLNCPISPYLGGRGTQDGESLATSLEKKTRASG